jgi:hypothetical protein
MTRAIALLFSIIFAVSSCFAGAAIDSGVLL